MLHSRWRREATGSPPVPGSSCERGWASGCTGTTERANEGSGAHRGSPSLSKSRADREVQTNMRRKVLTGIAAGVLLFLWLGVLGLSPSTTSQHQLSAGITAGLVWALRSVFRTRRLSKVLLEGILYGAGIVWFWAVPMLKPQLPGLSDWADRALTPPVTLGLALAPIVLGIAHRIYREVRATGTAQTLGSDPVLAAKSPPRRQP